MLQLWNLLQGLKTVFECFENGEDDIVRLMAVNDFVVLIEHQVNLEKRKFLLLCSNRTDFFLRVVPVFDLSGAVDSR